MALYFKRVLYSPEACLFAEVFLDRLKFGREDLDYRAAVQADEMVVMTMAEYMFVMGMLVVLVDLLDKAAFEEEGEGPVDRGP